MTGPDLVVVGVDGSAPSLDALRYALREALRRHAPVLVARAFDPLDTWGSRYGIVRTPTVAEVGARVEAANWEAVHAEQAADPALSGVEVDVVAVPGSPADVLLEQARYAGLLVVGHRGHGGTGATPIGSVALRCVLHAPCPITVVRTGAHPSGAPSTARDTAGATPG